MIKEFIHRFANNITRTGRLKSAPSTIGDSLIEDYNKTRRPALKGSFCYAPGVNMLFGQDGKIRACCHNRVFILGEYPKQTIGEIWRSEAYKELRNYLKSFDLSHGCDICQADVNTLNFEEVRARHFDSLSLHPEYPTMMEFMLSNTCNLECVMCHGENSSLIRKNREKLPPIISPYDKAFISQLEEFIPYLTETRFSSAGEAFSIDMNYDIWEMIIRLNPKCIIMVQTNGSYLNGRIKDLLSRGRFRIGVSLDSLQKETYEAIRVNANFERVMQNISYFSEYSRNQNEKFVISLCVMRQNWKELPEFIRFCNANNAGANLHKVWLPLDNALHNLPYKELNDIHNYLSSFDYTTLNDVEGLNKRHYSYMVSTINGWKQNAFQVEQEGGTVDRLKEEDLLPFLQSRLRGSLENGVVTGKEATEIIEICTGKIMEVLHDYENNTDRTTILKLMCNVPAFKMLKSLRYSPTESLKTQIRAFWASDLEKSK
jgi:MoaA/NifB/PqqE/SkfB family radical SAM enzyme